MKSRRSSYLIIMNSRQGVSLIELIVAVGVSTILTLASAMLITNVFQSNKMSEKRFDEISISRHIADLLQDETTCTKTLKGEMVPENTYRALNLVDQNGITDSATRHYYKVDGKKIGSGNIVIEGYYLDTSDPWVGVNTASDSAIGTVDFVVEFDRGKLASDDASARKFKRMGRLFVELEDTTATPLGDRKIKRCKLGDGYDLGLWYRDPVTRNINYNKTNITGGKAKVLIGFSKEKTTPASALNAILAIDNTYHERPRGMWIAGNLNFKAATNTSSTPSATIEQTFQAMETMVIPRRTDGCVGCPQGTMWIND